MRPHEVRELIELTLLALTVYLLIVFLFTGATVWFAVGCAALVVYVYARRFFIKDQAKTLRKPQKVGAEQQARAIFKTSLEIVSAYGECIERNNWPPHPVGSVKISETELPYNKEQIIRAVATLQRAIQHPELRALLVEMIPSIQAQHVLSQEFANSLSSGLVLLDCFVPAAEAKTDFEKRNAIWKTVCEIDPVAAERMQRDYIARQTKKPEK